MRYLIIIPFFFYSCTMPGSEDYRPAPAEVDPEITLLKVRVYFLEKDSIWQAKQIADLQRADQDFLITHINPIKARLYSLEKDSAYQRKQIDSLNRKFNFQLSSPLSLSIVSLKGDSVRQWNAINKALPITRFSKDSLSKSAQITVINSKIDLRVTSPMSTEIATLKSTTARQDIAIKTLQSTAPTVQIPIMQNDIKNIQSKNSTQDKLLIGLQSQVNTVQEKTDTILTYATKVNLVQFEIVNGVLTIPSLVTLQVRVAKLEEQAGGQPLP